MISEGPANRSGGPMTDRTVQSGSHDLTAAPTRGEPQAAVTPGGPPAPDGEQVADDFQRAADERPSISIRTRLMVGFLLFFALSAGQAAATWLILARVENKLEFLVAADR